MRKLYILIPLAIFTQLNLSAFTSKPTWTVNPPSYEYNAEVTARIKISGVTVPSGGMLGAFVGGECRGVRDGGSAGPGGYVFILFLYSNNSTGETIAFKFYDTASDQVYDITETVGYVTDTQIGNALTPTLLNCIVSDPSLYLNIKVLLEGAFNSSSGLMTTALNTGTGIPLSQPYNFTPWNYGGIEIAPSLPGGVVDWVLIELREAATPEDAIPATKLSGWPKVFFLKSDGAVVDLDGTSLPDMGSPTIANNLYVVIRHRNHLSIMSATGATYSDGVYSYDFTTGLAQAYGGGTGYKMAGSKAVMVAGDIDHDGSVFVSDFNSWAAGFGSAAGYYHPDLDMDGNVFVSDFNKWAANFGSTADIRIKLSRRKPWYTSCVPVK